MDAWSVQLGGEKNNNIKKKELQKQEEHLSTCLVSSGHSLPTRARGGGYRPEGRTEGTRTPARPKPAGALAGNETASTEGVIEASQGFWGSVDAEPQERLGFRLEISQKRKKKEKEKYSWEKKKKISSGE